MISSHRDLSPVYRTYAEELDEDGNLVFLFSSFGHFTAEYHAYFGQSKMRPIDLTVEEILECLKPLPDDDVYPKLPTPPITTFPGTIDDTVFLKKPKVNLDFIGTGILPKLVLQEAETMEVFLCQPHPNIIRYHGCVTRRGRIIGLVLDRYDMTLEQRLERHLIPNLDVDSFMEQIESAIEHLHKLGLAHNDLNPFNIMVDEDNKTLCLIDFGSCRPFGSSLITGGTPGWISEEYATSAKSNDEAALKMLRNWLQRKRAAQEGTGSETGGVKCQTQL